LVGQISIVSPFAKIRVYKTLDGALFLLANDLKPLLDTKTATPAGIRCFTSFDWRDFREWHKRELAEGIHASIRKAYILDVNLIDWVCKSSREVGNALKNLI
jgi:hypothetical protein